MRDRSILVIGGASTGKTHYGAQLMLRLDAENGSARYFEPPENIEPFQEVMKCLNCGTSADHTVGTTTKEVVLPLEFQEGDRARVVWPDYAGERLRELVRRRHAGDSWAKQVLNSDYWLLFVRHDQFTEARDLLTRPIATWTDTRKSIDHDLQWMPQAQSIELLQMLLFLRRASRRILLESPRLAVALSCWDTFPDRAEYEHPANALRSLAPLLMDFVESTWAPSARFVIGLSSTEKSLDKTIPDTEFMDKGPAAHGWVIKPDGQQSRDLTWPLVHLLCNT
jgi:hypothetical protein